MTKTMAWSASKNSKTISVSFDQPYAANQNPKLSLLESANQYHKTLGLTLGTLSYANETQEGHIVAARMTFDLAPRSSISRLTHLNCYDRTMTAQLA